MSTGQTLRRARENYDRYLDRRLGAPDGGSYPLSDVILDGDGGTAEANLGAPERECLVLFDESLPAFHEFSYRSLLHLPAQLVRSARVQVTPDHRHYWAWTAEVLRLGRPSADAIDRKLKRYFLLLVDTAVASLATFPPSHSPSDSPSRPLAGPSRDESEPVAADSNPHLFRAVTSSHRAASLMCYPVLEGLARRLCGADVRLDGTVKPGRRVSRIDGGVHRPGDRCNHFSHLLYHFERNVADDETAAALASVRSAVREFGDDHAYLTLQNWRNPNAHGGERLSGAEYAVVLTLICLLLWSQLGPDSHESVDTESYTTTIESDEGGACDPNGYYPLAETGALLSNR